MAKVPKLRASQREMDERADKLNEELFDPLANNIRDRMLDGVTLGEAWRGVCQAMYHAVIEARVMSRGGNPKEGDDVGDVEMYDLLFESSRAFCKVKPPWLSP